MAASILRTISAFLASVIVAFLASSALNTHSVLGRLADAGAPIPVGDQMAAYVNDAVGFLKLGLLPVTITIALALGFVVAFGVKRVLKPLAPIAYPVAGFAAMATALAVMHLQFEMTPLAGARGTWGFLQQSLAGGLGGLVFALLRPKA